MNVLPPLLGDSFPCCSLFSGPFSEPTEGFTMSFGDSVDPSGMELGSKEARTLAHDNTLVMHLIFFKSIGFYLFNQFLMVFHHLCQLQTGTCQEHLPVTEQQFQGYFYLTLQRLNPVLLQLLTFNTPQGRFRKESEASVLQGHWWNRSLDS